MGWAAAGGILEVAGAPRPNSQQMPTVLYEARRAPNSLRLGCRLAGAKLWPTSPYGYGGVSLCEADVYMYEGIIM